MSPPKNIWEWVFGTATLSTEIVGQYDTKYVYTTIPSVYFRRKKKQSKNNYFLIWNLQGWKEGCRGFRTFFPVFTFFRKFFIASLSPPTGPRVLLGPKKSPGLCPRSSPIICLKKNFLHMQPIKEIDQFFYYFVSWSLHGTHGGIWVKNAPICPP